ncbi:outer membrane lipoprotein [Celerinatantimonas yamalensis]|uniref:Glycine zipper 2TM domain-containing protein n=1 Tax=Celerinatantimonas yamalensis TaxID=559956 RepID=A0ABW9G4F5_9GAMM
MAIRAWFFIITLILSCPAWASYQRNVARPVEQVVFGQVESVRHMSQVESKQIHYNPWKTLLGSVVGGVVGHQFGRGWGRVVATGVGAVAGGAIVQNTQQPTLSTTRYQLVELLIRTDDKHQLIDVIQDYDPQMPFKRGQDVRILYFKDGVRVDTTY